MKIGLTQFLIVFIFRFVMRILLALMFLSCAIVQTAEVVVTDKTKVETCLEALTTDKAPMQLRVESFADLQSAHLQQLISELEAAGVDDFKVLVKESDGMYSTVVERIGNPAGKGWVQYGYTYDEEVGIVGPPWPTDILLRTPGGKLLIPPYGENREYNQAPWSSDGRYLVLAGGGEHHVLSVADLDAPTEPDWKNQISVSGKGAIWWVDSHVFEFSTWCCGCSHTVYRYDIKTSVLTKVKTVRHNHKKG